MADPRTRRPDESMTLLTEMFQRPLDPSYAAHAESRRQRGLPAADSMRSPIVVLTALVVGFLLAVAALALRPPQTERQQLKKDLVTRIESLQQKAATQQSQIEALQTELRGYEKKALGDNGATTLQKQLDALAVPSATLPVTGRGLTLTIDDPPDAQNADGQVDHRENGGFGNRVTSGDLQVVTNGLWRGGAEAIAINGQRLGSTSAIRFAGQAILVNYRALRPPYVISVIGDRDAMQKSFATGEAGPYLDQLQRGMKVQVTWAAADRLTLPADTSGGTSKAVVERGPVK